MHLTTINDKERYISNVTIINLVDIFEHAVIILKLTDFI